MHWFYISGKLAIGHLNIKPSGNRLAAWGNIILYTSRITPSETPVGTWISKNNNNTY